MRNRVGWGLIAGLLLCLPAPGLAQYDQVPATHFTGFLSHPRYEAGGFFVGIDFLYIRSENTLGSQTVAVRGFRDLDGSISGKAPNTFIGSEKDALNTNQLHGPRNYSPGFDLTAGWRFDDGVVIQATWWHLTEVKLWAGADLVPPAFEVGNQLENTFLSSPVINFSPLYAGNAKNVNAGNDGATYGIWNAASQMQISMLERFELVEMCVRMPWVQTENYRCFGTFGPRAVIMWQRFRWMTVDSSLAGPGGPSETGWYSNVISNRLYGPFAGCSNEWFLGSTPIGGFSVSVDLEGALYLDMVKERARYELGDRTTAASRARNTYTMAPGVQGKLSFWWYPWEAVTLHFGWDALLFFNTVTSREPIDFNMGSITPQYDKHTIRYFHGLQLGVGFVF